jgi:hypothetical protein
MDMASCVESKGLWICKQMRLYADLADLAEQVVVRSQRLKLPCRQSRL